MATRKAMIDTERHISERGLRESSTELIDPLSTVIVARGATTGRIVMFGERMAMNQTCYAVRGHDDDHYFIYCLLRDSITDLAHATHGSVFDTITTSTFKTRSVLIPSLELSGELRVPQTERAVAEVI